MNGSRRSSPLLLLLLTACATASPPDPVADVRGYLSATTLEEAQSALAPDYRIWFGARSGEGISRERVIRMLEWDYALNPRTRIDAISARGSEVTVRVHEDNDFSLLIGFPGWDATSTFVVGERGQIESQLYVPTGPTEWRPYLEAPLAWIYEHHPDAIGRIFPNGKLGQTRDTAVEWVALLRAWRAATGQTDPTTHERNH